MCYCRSVENVSGFELVKQAEWCNLFKHLHIALTIEKYNKAKITNKSQESKYNLRNK